jgi:hypothetical protein
MHAAIIHVKELHASLYTSYACTYILRVFLFAKPKHDYMKTYVEVRRCSR